MHRHDVHNGRHLLSRKVFIYNPHGIQAMCKYIISQILGTIEGWQPGRGVRHLKTRILAIFLWQKLHILLERKAPVIVDSSVDCTRNAVCTLKCSHHLCSVIFMVNCVFTEALLRLILDLCMKSRGHIMSESN